MAVGSELFISELSSDALCSRWNAFSGDSDTVTLRLAGLYARLHTFAATVLQLQFV